MSELERSYRQRYDEVLRPLSIAIEGQLRDYLQGVPRIDRVTARAKDVDSFLKKARTTIDGDAKYQEPLSQIQDQLGARIVTFFDSDVADLDRFVMKYYRPIEIKNHVPESEWEFGYFGRHYVLLVPSDVLRDNMDRGLIPGFFELQIKTLFQHAWSEAEHDLGYKPGLKPLNPSEKRRLAFASAQAWGADRIFDELFRERNTSAGGRPPSRGHIITMKPPPGA
jgi:ppGpp synthetase/RelA/SpoT-type nucleotidyltranferase